MLQRYGVLANNTTPISVLCQNFLSQAKTDTIKFYNEILEELKKLAKEESDAREKAANNAASAAAVVVAKPEVVVEAARKEEEKAVPEMKVKNCDVILAEYLFEMARKVSDKFFVTLIIFARLYRDYMNLHGWDIMGKYKTVTTEEKTKVFAQCNGAEHVPEACNEFAKSYLPKEHPNFDQDIGVDITLHLCDWLYRKSYTHTRISRI